METVGIVVIVVIALSMLKSIGKAAPLVMLLGFIYWLSYYIWDWICWILAIVVTLAFLKQMWDDIRKVS